MAAGDPPRRRTRRMLLSFLWPLGIGDRETAQAEPVTTAAVRASQHRQNCATSVACRLLRISTREAIHILRAHASPLLPLCLLVDAISDVFLAAMRTLPLPSAVAFNTRRARLRRRPRTSRSCTRRPDPPGPRVRAGITVKRVPPDPACGSQSIA
jgi:hypothetical protein